MSTKFFNNNHGNTLFEKFKGIAEGMPNLHSFLAVVGYFRSSGYFKLRKELVVLEPQYALFRPRFGNWQGFHYVSLSRQ